VLAVRNLSRPFEGKDAEQCLLDPCKEKKGRKRKNFEEFFCAASLCYIHFQTPRHKVFERVGPFLTFSLASVMNSFLLLAVTIYQLAWVEEHHWWQSGKELWEVEIPNMVVLPEERLVKPKFSVKRSWRVEYTSAISIVAIPRLQMSTFF